MHVLNAVHPILPWVPEGCVGTNLYMIDQLEPHTLHGTESVDEGVVTKIQGNEVLYGQVGNPVT